MGEEATPSRPSLSRSYLGTRKYPMASGHTRFAISLYLFLLVPFHLAFAKSSGVANPPAGVVLVAATVEGQSATLLLDTGAERSCLDTRFAAQLRLGSASVERIRQPYATVTAGSIRIEDIEIDSFHLQHMELLSSDLSSTSLAAGVPIDGILGSDVLRHFAVRIDFSSGSTQFQMNTSVPARGVVVTLQSTNNLYFVPLNIQGTPVRLLLDTGTNGSSVSSHAWSAITMHWRPQTMLNGVRSSGGSESAKFVLIPNVDIGGATSRNVPLRVQSQTRDGLFADANFDGLLGTDVLRQFIVTLDLANNRMYLIRNPNSHVDRYLFSTIGIQFAKNVDGDFTIMAVWNPSPAAKAGLKVGDLILAVDQLDTRQMGLDDLSREIHGQPGTEVNLVIDSGGHKHSVAVAIGCLLCP
jgi:predicted aspartyl protease